MRITNIDVVDKEHSVERFDEKYNLFPLLLGRFFDLLREQTNKQICCQQQREANVVWRIGLLQWSS
jgi:hypothetical protein